MRYVYSRGAVVSPRLQRESPHFNQHLLMKFFIDVQKGDMKSYEDKVNHSINIKAGIAKKQYLLFIGWLV